MTTATKLTTRQDASDAQMGSAGGDHLDHGQAATGPHTRTAVVDTHPAQAIGTSTPMLATPVPDLTAYRHLRVMANMLWDLQHARIAISNRVLSADIDPTLYQATLEGAERAEHVCRLELARQYRRTVSPEIREWQKATRGVGEHILASLLGVIGHPVWTEKHRWDGEGADRHLIILGTYRRRVSDLWSYCGHGDPTRRPRRGMTAEEATSLGAPRAKTIVWLLACAQLKSNGPYRTVYDQARERYEERDWTTGHRHNAALRLVGKHILRDLWIAAGGPQA